MPVYYRGFNRGPGRGGGGFGLIFLILLLIGGPGMVVIPTLIYFFPILAIGFFTYSLIKGLATNNKKTRTTYKTNTIKRNNGMSNADITKIDKKLTTYFKNNITLPVIDDIELETQSGKYTAIDQLYLTYKNEKVAKLVDFKNENFAMYQKIVELLKAFSKQPDSVLKEKVKVEENVKKENIFSDAQRYIDKINDLNAAIPQEEITNGLYQTCDLLNKIEKSKQSKQDKAKLTKLYDYYLPILTGILENYKGLQDNAIKGEEFKKCEAQLIKTIMLINQALKTLYADMHADDYLNINADINTLQTLLEKDGFGEDPFATKETK